MQYGAPPGNGNYPAYPQPYSQQPGPYAQQQPSFPPQQAPPLSQPPRLVNQGCRRRTPPTHRLLPLSNIRNPARQAFPHPSIMDLHSLSLRARLHLFHRTNFSLPLPTTIHKMGYPRGLRICHQPPGYLRDHLLVLHLSMPSRCSRCIRVRCLGLPIMGKGLHHYLLTQARLMTSFRAPQKTLIEPMPHLKSKSYK